MITKSALTIPALATYAGNPMQNLVLTGSGFSHQADWCGRILSTRMNSPHNVQDAPGMSSSQHTLLYRSLKTTKYPMAALSSMTRKGRWKMKVSQRAHSGSYRGHKTPVPSYALLTVMPCARPAWGTAAAAQGEHSSLPTVGQPAWYTAKKSGLPKVQCHPCILHLRDAALIQAGRGCQTMFPALPWPWHPLPQCSRCCPRAPCSAACCPPPCPANRDNIRSQSYVQQLAGPPCGMRRRQA